MLKKSIQLLSEDKMKQKWYYVLIIAVSFFVGMLFQLGLSTQKEVEKMDVLEEMTKVIFDNFSTENPLDKTKLKIEALKTITQNLEDTYSTYMNKEEYQKFREEASGKYYGVGFHVAVPTEKESKWIIDQVFEDSPAFQAGIIRGDILLKIEDQAVEKMSKEKISSFLRGKSPQTLKLEIHRPADGSVKQYSISKDEIEIRAIYHRMLTKEKGYILLTQIIPGIEKEFELVLENLKSQGMKTLILDLRNNTGGEVSSANHIASFLLEEKMNEFLVFKNKMNGRRVAYKREKKQIFNGWINILVNEKTASAAEFLVDALKRTERAKVIGTKTFGKGVIQAVIENESTKTALRLTVAHYLLNNGEYMNKTGIRPDIEVEMESILMEPFFTKESEYNEKIRNQNIASILMERYGESKAKEMLKQGDIQLKKAMEAEQNKSK